MMPNQSLAMQRRMVKALQDPGRYPHPVSRVRVIETHISFVLLTGSFAYKIKKAVDLGFVDYTSLEKRRLFCAEELRLNRRLAPQLYLDVIAIGGGPDAPSPGTGDPPFDYAVKMAEFAQDDLLDRLLAGGRLRSAHIDALAGRVAAFHGGIPAAAPQSAYGSPGEVWAPVAANFSHIRALCGTDDRQLRRIEAWSTAEFERLREVFAERKAGGFVRECHGDLHLGNMALVDGEPVVFDCIEFNPALRWIDIISDLAFLTMDLSERGQPDYAWRLLNDWLERLGDHAGLDLLRFYLVYRAMVRAKVASIRAAADGLPAPERDAALAEAARYADYAEATAGGRRSALCLTHGLSGSGKSTLAAAAAQTLGAVRLRSDVERKRMHGLPPLAGSGSGLDSGLYGEAATAATYGRLAELAARVVAAGYPVVVDAANLRRWQRQHFRDLAVKMGVPFTILDCKAPTPILRQRLAGRAADGQDPSEATPAVLEHQIATAEPLAPDELAVTVTIDTAADDPEQTLRKLRQMLGMAA